MEHLERWPIGRPVVLLVDDNAEERSIFASYIRFTGFEVIEAENGLEGYRLAVRHRPGLILLDLAMPIMNGWRTIERLKVDERVAGIQVTALTAFRLDPRQLAAAGFCGYLEKPIAPHRVLSLVEGVLGQRDRD